MKMATTFSQYFPQSLHSNFEHSDITYSYSDLPVFHSKLNTNYTYLKCVKPKSGTYSCVVNNNYKHSSYVQPKHCQHNEQSSLSLQNSNIPINFIRCENVRSSHGRSCESKQNNTQKCQRVSSNVNKAIDVINQVNGNFIPDLLIDNKLVNNKNNNYVSCDNRKEPKELRPSRSFSRVEGLRKKFEFQTRLTKSVDSSNLEQRKSKFNIGNSFNSSKFGGKCDKKEIPLIEETDENLLCDKKTINILKKNINPDICTSVNVNVPTSDNILESTKHIDNSNKIKGKTNNLADKESDHNNLASSVLRLKKSIFSSLKLPRKVSVKMSSQQQLSGRDTLPGRNFSAHNSSLSSTLSKKKSAVELLAESKAFYVKSETVLDRKQELPLRLNSTLSTGTNSGIHYATLSGRHRKGCTGEALQNQLRRLLGPTNVQSPDIHQQNKNHNLKYERKIKDDYDWNTNVHSKLITRSHYNSATFSGNSSSGTSGSKGQIKSDPEHSCVSSGGYYSSKSLNRPSSSGDNRIFFPDSFVIPKSSKSDPSNVFFNSFSIESPYSSPEKIDTRKILSVVDAYDNCSYGRLDVTNEYYNDKDIIENYTISPPAEYAVTERSNYRYTRSNSHSNTTKSNPENSYAINFNSHKSLPDLHKQTDNFNANERHLSSNRHHISKPTTDQNLGTPSHSQAIRSSEALSNYSKGTSGNSCRSNPLSAKDSDGYSRRSASGHNIDLSGHTGKGSVDEIYFYNRSNSSYARDSGGSSGHCSGPLGPPSLRGLPPVSNAQQRRDSGSSTQHSSTRYSSYFIDQYEDTNVADISHLEYHVSAPLEFQDGIQFNQGSNNTQLNVNATVSISTNFTSHNENFKGSNASHAGTNIVSDRPALVGIHFQASIPPVQFQDTKHDYSYSGSTYPPEGFYGRRESGTRESRHLLTRRPASYGCNQISTTYDEEHEGARSLPHDIEGSPPSSSGLGNFKRQRCLRFKHRSPRRPILRSKSDISDRYWRTDDKEILSVVNKPSVECSPPSSENNSPIHTIRTQLDKFFDQLGMDDETYNEVILKDLKKPRRKNRNKSSPSRDNDLNTNSKGSDDEANDELSSSFASSDLSFPDSNLIPNNADYTVQGGPQNDKPYRSYEPLSIVERNARIIKWLCNCRKLQAV